MEKTYNPKEFEERIYQKWIDEKAFAADADSDKPSFTIAMPPPNITGQLHMGHALNNTMQDIMTRYKRMRGYSALWVPGTDHASIATEAKIVEKLKSEGIDKKTLGREKYLERAWKWKEQYGGRIISQLYKIGCSCDWDRLAFTMDEPRGKAVAEVFVNLYNSGEIYKGDRIINWCPDCKTALSDAEVEHEETHGSLWHIRYDFSDGSGSIVVATTRPETMLGDTAVAVNPADKRYQGFLGKTLKLPLTDRLIPLIADSYVEQGFGTGAVKITPAHDPNDFEVGLRHSLKVIRIMDDSGVINDSGYKYKGLDRFAARKAIIAGLEAEGRLVKIEKHTSNKGYCYRCGQSVEPIVSKQWFVKMDKLVVPAIDAVKNGVVKFTPKRMEKIYFNWLNNIKDWCISRQLWWGHRIPAYTCTACGKMVVAADAPEKCACGHAKFVQDEDVLDTWFSSALWPFSTLGWPENSKDIKKYYPTDLLITAQDIIFFWVARMIFAGYRFMGKAPFSHVVFNGLVRDKCGKKMSKSAGNGVDPLELIDSYGADALRFSLLFGSSNGSDMRFSAEKVALDRAFIAKIWNAGRFVVMNTEDVEIIHSEKLKPNACDKWIMHRFNAMLKKVVRNLDKYEMGQAVKAMYGFVRNDFCDWYIELCKPLMLSKDKAVKSHAVSMIKDVLDKTLRVLHPVIPFVTEEIYSHLSKGSIMLADYPEGYKAQKLNSGYSDTEKMMDIIRAVRELRASLKIPQQKKTEVYIKPLTDKKLVEDSIYYLTGLCSASNIVITAQKPDGNPAAVVTDCAEVYIPLDNSDNQKEIERLAKELEFAKAELKRAQGKLANTGFTSKAPDSLIKEEQEKVEKYSALVEKIESLLK